jgi:hypothetical protein
MAYNLLSGTVIANETVIVQPPDDDGKNIVEGKFFGDGTNITNVARITSNGTTDYLLTVGSNAESLVGEPNLQFNGSRLYVNGAITASAVHLPSVRQQLPLTLLSMQITTSSLLPPQVVEAEAEAVHQHRDLLDLYNFKLGLVVYRAHLI